MHASRRSVLAAGAVLAPGLAWARSERPPLVPVAAQRADLAALYETLQATHFDLFARLPKAAYESLYINTMRRLDAPLPQSDVERLFQRFVAAGRIAHARIDYLLPRYAAFREAGGLAIPLTVRIRDNRLYVLETLSPTTDLSPGDELLALNGVATPKLLDRLWRHVSADTPYMAHSLIELDFAPLVWTEFGERSHVSLSVKDAQGRRRHVRLAARTRAETAAAPRASLLSIDVAERSARMIDEIAYLRPGIFMNLAEGEDPYDTTRFQAFIDESFTQLRNARARALMLDLRDNPGGHNAFSDYMVSYWATRPFRFYRRFAVRASAQAVAANAERLATSAPGGAVSRILAEAYARAPQPGAIVELDGPHAEPRAEGRFEGPVYVLINRRAYSNAVATAALIQDYGFGHILGEETSDLATTHGAMEQFTLPRSGITVGYPKAYIVRPNGDETPRGVVPDIAIETPLIETQDDQVLKRACKIIQAAGRS